VTLLDGRPQPPAGTPEADALIEEARHRQRRRRWAISIVALLVAIVGAIAIFGLPGRTLPPRGASGTTAPHPSISRGQTGVGAHLHVNWDSVAGAAGSLWLLGEHTSASGTCFSILRTTNDGTSFTRVPVPPVSLPAKESEGEYGATVRFANRDDGYFYVHSPAARLYWTGDGGRHWRLSQPGGSSPWRASLPAGGLASTIVTTNGRAYALVPGDCSKLTCRSIALAASKVTTDTWTTTPLPVPADHGQVGLAAFGSTVWIMEIPNGGGDAYLLVSDDGGRTFSSLPSTGTLDGISCTATATSSVTLWGFCATGNGGFAVRSTDGGRLFSAVQVPGGESNSDRVLAISATEAIYVVPSSPYLLVTRDGGQHFASMLPSTEHEYASDVGFADKARWLALEFSQGGAVKQMWRTSNAGRTWQALKPPED